MRTHVTLNTIQGPFLRAWMLNRVQHDVVITKPELLSIVPNPRTPVIFLMLNKVSVILPVHNAQATILSAASSILRQTLREIELIVVDDGSTDSTPHILASLAQTDPRVKVITTQQSGIVTALNIAIENSSSEYLARMDADDISHPKRLEKQLEYLDRNTDISVISSNIRMFPKPDVIGGLIHYEQWLNSLTLPHEISRDIFVESPVVHPSIMLRRSEIIEMGCYHESRWAEDYDLWLRYELAGGKLAKLSETLFFWRQSEGRLTFTDGRYSVENFIRAKAFYLHEMLKTTDRPILVWGAGKTGRRLTKHLVRSGLKISAIIDVDSKKIGHTLRGLPIIGHECVPGYKNPFVISAVSSHKARILIREQLNAYGMIERRDYICAA